MLTGKARRCIKQTVLDWTDEKHTHINISIQTHWQRLCVRPYLRLHHTKGPEKRLLFQFS